MISRYEPSSKKVEVPHLWSKQVNFTLKTSDSQDWSLREDFSITENLGETYLSNSELSAAMAKIENEYKEVAEFLANENEWSMKIHALYMAAEVRETVNMLSFNDIEHLPSLSIFEHVCNVAMYIQVFKFLTNSKSHHLTTEFEF